MDSDLVELESLISDHFGRTPVASQNYSFHDNEDSEPDHEEDIKPQLDIEQRVKTYLDHQIANNIETDSNDGSENDGSDIDGVDIEPFGKETDDDAVKIRNFLKDGCGCKRKCHMLLRFDQVYEHILNVRAMDNNEKDMYLMGILYSDSDQEKTKRGKKRKRVRPIFTFSGKQVCRKTFILTHDIGRCVLANIVKHMKTHGVMPRTHGNAGKKPLHALTLEDIQRIVQFITNYADEFGMPQPAAPRGRDNIAPIYLSCQTTKTMVHAEYQTSCTEANHRFLKRTVFNYIWNTCLGHIKLATPRDDICATCEKLRKAVADSVSEEEMLQTSNSMRDHILTAQKERALYNDCIRLAKATNEHDPQTRYNHYTFDFGQNVCIPHRAGQTGPVYFKTLRKIQLFGFRIDRIPTQLNFLVDESETIGPDGTKSHEPNAVISMVDWALGRCCDGETACSFHADNDPGQNKNQFMIGYFMWRVMTNQHQNIEYHTQVPGHARSLVSSGFDAIKKHYRQSDCDTIDHLTEVVDSSGTSNSAVRYPAWQWLDWERFLSSVFKPIAGIRKYQSFRMSSDEPGIVSVLTGVDNEERKISILKNPAHRFESDLRPAVIAAAGLTPERQHYLYTSVRSFVRPDFQDETCPAP